MNDKENNADVLGQDLLGEITSEITPIDISTEVLDIFPSVEVKKDEGEQLDTVVS